MHRHPFTTRFVVGLVALALLAGACGSDDDPSAVDTTDASTPGSPPVSTTSAVERTAADPAAVEEVVPGLNQFGFDYFALLIGSDPGADIVFSPMSIAMAAGMVEAGARGQTATEFAEVFGFPSADGDATHAGYNALEQALAETPEATVRVANRLFPRTDFPIEQDFVDTLARHYGATPELLDYAGDPDGSQAHINQWVADRTEGLIPDLLPAGFISPQTVLVLVNAMYLEAQWMVPFAGGATEPGPFTLVDGTEIETPLMHASELPTTVGEGDGWQAVEIPYNGSELSMLVIVPDEGRFDDVQTSFDADLVAGVDSAMESGSVSLTLPSWSSEFSDPVLLDHLSALGITTIPGGDFSGISATAPPALSDGVHAATIDVDENGTIASAATAFGFDESAAPTPTELTVDRPFLYLIRHQPTGAVLFAGRVMDPST